MRRAQNDGHAARRDVCESKGDAVATLGMLSQPNSTATEEHKAPVRKTLAKVDAKLSLRSPGQSSVRQIGRDFDAMLRDFLQAAPAISNGRGLEDANTTDKMLPKGKTMIEDGRRIQSGNFQRAWRVG